MRPVASLEPGADMLTERLELVPVMACIAESDGRCTFANRALLQFLGQSSEQFALHGWRRVAHPDDLQRMLEAFQAPTAHNHPLLVNVRLRQAGGEYRSMAMHGMPYKEA